MNSTPPVIKGLSVLLMLAGLLWASAIGWMFLALSAIAQSVSFVRTLLYFVALLAGPLGLMLGSYLVFRETHVKLGVIFTLITCAILTVLVGNELMGLFHREPLQAPPNYYFYASLAAFVLISDLAAAFLWQFYFHLTSR